MMDVGLVNDGPVGVDFRCIDEAVNLLDSVSGTLANQILGHYRDRLQPSPDGQPFWLATTRGG